MQFSPMMDLSQTLISLRNIRVAVVQIGAVPAHKFKYYLDIINSCNSCELVELPAVDVYTTGTKRTNNSKLLGPFPNRNWKEASIHLNFETRNKEDESFQDEWGTVQAHRRILGVLLGLSLITCKGIRHLPL
jgi:hypothetical protein